jgi:hypothetical protein
LGGFRNSEFVAGVGADGVVRHQLCGNLLRQRPIQSALDVNAGQFAVFCIRVMSQFRLF